MNTQITILLSNSKSKNLGYPYTLVLGSYTEVVEFDSFLDAVTHAKLCECDLYQDHELVYKHSRN